MSSTDTGFGGPFWERKFKTYFRRMDHDGDGYMTKNDFEQLADRYAQIGNLDDVKAKQARRKILKIWYDFYEAGSTNGKIDETALINVNIIRESMMFKACVEYFGLFFDLIDINGDGFIQKEEFEIFHSAFGITRKDVTAECFKAIDTNGDGKLSCDEFIQAGYQFFTSGDESLPSKFMYGPLIDD